MTWEFPVVTFQQPQIASVKLRLNSQEYTMNFTTRFKKWRTYRRTFNELSQLSNRELDDLGLHRGEIAAIARRVS